MSVFLCVSLVAFAVCAWLGLIPAASQRKPVLVAVVLIAAAFATFVLLTAAGDLR